jgi:hypothetical protein
LLLRLAIVLGAIMGKEPIKFKYKNRRKPEYTKEGMVQLEKFHQENQGRFGLEVDPVILGLRKRGYGRGKARDAGPTKKKTA